MSKVSVKIERDLHHELEDMGKKGETFHDVIRKLKDFWDAHHPEE